MSSLIESSSFVNIWDKYSVLAQSAILGVGRGLFGLPLEHPFDSIKTNMQTYQKCFSQTFQTIYQRKGILGFYSGFVINSMRVGSKQLYRWPMTLLFFGIYQ